MNLARSANLLSRTASGVPIFKGLVFNKEIVKIKKRKKKGVLLGNCIFLDLCPVYYGIVLVCMMAMLWN